MSHQLDKTYDPQKYEAKLYQQWEDSGAFQPDMKAPKDPFSIIMPPPNANGDLHLGHAMYVVEDVMIRYRRMQGHKALWLPGADHAGIETQVMYERQLQKQGKSRFDLGREQFYKEVWDFSHLNMTNMQDQVRQLGFSVDWSRFKFTLDEDIVSTVYDTFKELHEAGYIYRGNRIVNWCPFCRSAFADIEIKYREQKDPLYYIKYGPFVLATVRPETKFGDTAIAVNPKDERYAKYVGQTIEAEDLNGPIRLRVIADDFVNPEFGTGVVKVTPAHDPNDYAVWQRHKGQADEIDLINILTPDGRLVDDSRWQKYAGMKRDTARAKVVEDLKAAGLLEKEEPYETQVGHSDRSKTPIEPYLSDQWFVKMAPLAEPALEVVREGTIKFTPARFA
ncbi:MAG: valS, partial [Patescibacteria group bacterium]|nr:valS [Patescibacteria group bacterium]